MRYRTLSLLFVLTMTLISCKSSDSLKSHLPNNTLKMSANQDPGILDPRQVRSLEAATFVHLLYEGLMRHGEKGELLPALAQSISLSHDRTVYTFKLYPSTWSNGAPVTASDFVYSWKKVLSPSFPAPNAYQFYLIKGAKEAKERKGSLEDVGVKALDDLTLEVTLNQPTANFLELMAFHPFFPISQKWEETHPQWFDGPPADIIGNGPFKLEKWALNNVIVYEKNPLYREASEVKFDQLVFMILEENTAYLMFQRRQLDWTGSPLSILPPDAMDHLKTIGRLHIAPAAGVSWFRLNTEKPPFDQQKMRQAFSYAINRKALVDHILKGDQLPAMGVIPPSLITTPAYFEDHDINKARELFQQALEEKGLIKDQLPPVTFTYIKNERSHKIAQAVQQDWQRAFGIPIQLDPKEGGFFFEKLKAQDYQIASGSWFADIRDPLNFLEVFKSKNNGTNNTGWENPVYSQLLSQAAEENDPHLRQAQLLKAEKILMEEMPVIPLFFNTFSYVKNPFLRNVHLLDLGYLDLSRAYIDHTLPPGENL